MLADPGVRAALDRFWPALTPQRLLSDLYASAERVDNAAPRFDAEERRLLLRDPDAG